MLNNTIKNIYFRIYILPTEDRNAINFTPIHQLIPTLIKNCSEERFTFFW